MPSAAKAAAGAGVFVPAAAAMKGLTASSAWASPWVDSELPAWLLLLLLVAEGAGCPAAAPEDTATAANSSVYKHTVVEADKKADSRFVA